ncbi:MAG: hypothetical protein KBD78_06895 [Oligoflexales bacterium]|nr:hypothetical protein [Oligoflexales bacterium]
MKNINPALGNFLRIILVFASGFCITLCKPKVESASSSTSGSNQSIAKKNVSFVQKIEFNIRLAEGSLLEDIGSDTLNSSDISLIIGNVNTDINSPELKNFVNSCIYKTGPHNSPITREDLLSFVARLPIERSVAVNEGAEGNNVTNGFSYNECPYPGNSLLHWVCIHSINLEASDEAGNYIFKVDYNKNLTLRETVINNIAPVLNTRLSSYINKLVSDKNNFPSTECKSQHERIFGNRRQIASSAPPAARSVDTASPGDNPKVVRYQNQKKLEEAKAKKQKYAFLALEPSMKCNQLQNGNNLLDRRVPVALKDENINLKVGEYLSTTYDCAQFCSGNLLKVKPKITHIVDWSEYPVDMTVDEKTEHRHGVLDARSYNFCL